MLLWIPLLSCKCTMRVYSFLKSGASGLYLPPSRIEAPNTLDSVQRFNVACKMKMYKGSTTGMR